MGLGPGQEASGNFGDHLLDGRVGRGGGGLDEGDAADVGFVLDERGDDLEDEAGRRFEGGDVGRRELFSSGDELVAGDGDAGHLEHGIAFGLEQEAAAVGLGLGEDRVDFLKVGGHEDSLDERRYEKLEIGDRIPRRKEMELRFPFIRMGTDLPVSRVFFIR